MLAGPRWTARILAGLAIFFLLVGWLSLIGVLGSPTEKESSKYWSQVRFCVGGALLGIWMSSVLWLLIRIASQCQQVEQPNSEPWKKRLLKRLGGNRGLRIWVISCAAFV